MVYALQGQLTFTTAARRDTVLANLQARIAGRARFGVEYLGSMDFTKYGLGANGIWINLRFRAKADQDDLIARIDAVGTGVNAPQPGSWLDIHDCAADVEPPAPQCVLTRARTW